MTSRSSTAARTEAAPLPSSATAPGPTIAITDLEALAAAGVHHPKTVWAWRGLIRNRRHNGLDKCFVKLGRRVLVNVPAYLEALRQKAAKGF